MNVTAETTSDLTPEVAKKIRKRSEYRTLYGSKAIRETSAEVQKIMADFQSYHETCDRYIAAGIFNSRNECVTGNADGLKIVPPTGVTELTNLRKMVRMALMRPEIVVDAIKLCQVAEFVARLIDENDILVARASIENEIENDKQPN